MTTTVRLNPELALILAAAPQTQYAQVRALDSALTANKRVKAKRHANAATAQADVWATGTLFRDAALVGGFTFNRAVITKFGVTSDLQTCLNADLSTGVSVIRIEGGGHWLEGTFGLTRAAQTALGIPANQQKDYNFTFPTNPTTTNSIALSGTLRILANQLLVDGSPDTDAPVTAVVSSADIVNAISNITLTATASDDIGVTRVELLRDGVLRQTKNSAPWEFVEPLTLEENGAVVYTTRAYDASGKVGTSANKAVTVNIPYPIETGTATAVGAQLTDISFQNLAASQQTNVPVTFGQVFAIGALPAANAAVDLKAPDNSLVTCQLDAKAFHDDGSVRHAILSTILPSLAASSTATYSIMRRAAPPAGTAAVPADFAGLNAVVTMTPTGTALGGPVVGSEYTADAAPLLAAGTFAEVHLSGPIVTEWIVRAPFKTAGGAVHPDLHARFSIRAYKGQAKAKIDYIIENNWAKPLATPAGGSPWEAVSLTDQVYRFSLKAGATTVHTRAAKGYIPTVALANGGGTFDGNLTRLPNNSTVFTAEVTVDSVVKNLSITGSAAQTHQQLRALINTQLGGMATCTADDTNQGLKIASVTTGPASHARITNYGTLFPALKGTGLNGDTTNPVTYTATITIDGSIVKNISILGHQAQSFGELCALLNTQMQGAATATPQLAAPGIGFVSTSTGQSTGVVITNKGTLFTVTELRYMTAYRPIYGDEVIHRARTRWKKTFWWGAEPQVHVAHNKAYLMATKAVPNYDPTLTGSTTVIASRLAEMLGNEDIGQNGITKAMMGDVGYAPGIGLLPEWAAMYLINQGKDAKYVLLKQADLMGSWPAHFRDYVTDRPLSFERWPYASTIGVQGDSYNSATGLNEKLPDVIASGTLQDNRNIADVAHHPDFCFLPYLVTGDHYYMEGMLFYQRYTAAQMNPSSNYRDGRRSLWKPDQTRGQAWMLRTTVHTAYLLPANHPERTDVLYQLEQNCLWYLATYVNASGTNYNALGVMDAGLYTAGYDIGSDRYGYQDAKAKGQSAVACWQEDFVTSAAGRAIELGFKNWTPFFKFKSKFHVGRLTTAGVCWRLGMAYVWRIRDSATNRTVYPDFKTAYDNTFSAAILAAGCSSAEMTTELSKMEGGRNVANTMPGYPDLIAGYVSNGQPAVAYGATFDVPGGDNAWLVFEARSLKPPYNDGPQFAIVPRN